MTDIGHDFAVKKKEKSRGLSFVLFGLCSALTVERPAVAESSQFTSSLIAVMKAIPLNRPTHKAAYIQQMYVYTNRQLLCMHTKKIKSSLPALFH